jgi:hypothetical protein
MKDLQNSPELAELGNYDDQSENFKNGGITPSERNSYLSFEETRKFGKEDTGSVGLSDRLASLREQERVLKLRLKTSDLEY